MLLQIREYIQYQGVVSSQQLTRQFQIDEQALQPMLDFWERKGVIRPCQMKNACQTRCFKCNLNKPLYYEIA